MIKDYGRGLIIGDSSTFGKGTVQSIVPINEQLRRAATCPNLGALKLTIQQFYRANGESTQIKRRRARHPHPLDPRPDATSAKGRWTTP